MIDQQVSARAETNLTSFSKLVEIDSCNDEHTSIHLLKEMLALTQRKSDLEKEKLKNDAAREKEKLKNDVAREKEKLKKLEDESELYNEYITFSTFATKWQTLFSSKDSVAHLSSEFVQEAYNAAIVCIGPVPLDRVDCTQVWPAFDDLLVSSGIEEGPDPILLQCVRDLIKMSSRLAVRARSHALWEWDHDGIASGVLDGAAQVGEQGCPVPNFYDYLHTHQTTSPQVLQRIVAYAGADGVEQMQWSKESLGYRDMSHLPIVETMRSTGTTTEGGIQESWEYLDRAGMLDIRARSPCPTPCS